MKEHSITPIINNEQNYGWRVSRAFLAATMAVSAAACIEVAQSAPGGQAKATHESTPSARSVSPSTSASTLQPLPHDWPDTATLPPQDCSWGASIDHQAPLQIDSHVAGVVDTRCEPPEEQPYANVHTEPSRTAPITGRAYDSQVVRLDCQIEGQPIGDNRGPRDFKNPQWFRITYKKRDNANTQATGYVAGANLGQIEVDPHGHGTDVPPCR